MTRLITLAVLAAAFAAGGAWVLTRDSGDQVATNALELPAGAAFAQEAGSGEADVVEMALGDPDAPVTVIEYASFTCPHCARFHSDQYPQLKANYIDTGDVRFIYRDVYFDRIGLWASIVARCEPERFFGVTELLYAQQSEWAAASDPSEIAENLRRIGLSAGLSQDAIDQCFNDAEKAAALVAWWEENAAADNVRSTPTLIIDGESYPNMSYADLAAILDERLEAAN